MGKCCTQRTSFEGVAELGLLQKAQKVERVRKDNEAGILWRPPVLQVLEVGDKVGRVEVLVLRENCARLRHNGQEEKERKREECRKRIKEEKNI